MKRMGIFLLVLIAMAYSAFSQQANQKLERELKKLDQELYESALREDAAAFNRITSDDYTNTGSGGEIRSKAEIMREFNPARKRCSSKPIELDLSATKVRVYGKTAIVTGLATEASELFSDDCKPIGSKMISTNRYINVFVNQQGVWRAVATQFTSIGIN